MFNTNFNQISKEDLSMNNQRTGRTYAELTERFNKLAEDFECRNMSKQARAKQKSERYNKAFWEQMTVASFSNSLKEGSDGSGGYLVPDTFENKIVEGLKENNILRKLATTIKTNHTMKVPRVVSGSAAQWITENSPYIESGVTFDEIKLEAHKLAMSIIVSEELIDDSAIDLERYLTNNIISAFSQSEEEAFFCGDGNGKPTGLKYQASVGVETADAGTVSLDDIIDLIYSIRQPYRAKKDACCLIMSESAYLELKKIKVANGKYIWNTNIKKDGYDTLFGYKVYTTKYLDDIEYGSIPILFGDFSKFVIGERKRPIIKRLGEIRAKYGQIEYVASERIDAKLFDTEAVKALKVKSE